MKPTKQSPSAGYAPVNGINMYYEIHGNGPVVVLIHGGGSTLITSFGNILPLLAEDYRVIAVELQAHGRTTDRDAPESFEQDANDLAALMKHLEIARASFLGFSNGGMTAMNLAARYPQLVDKLVVVSGACKRTGFIDGFFQGLENATLTDMPQYLQQGYLAVNPDNAGLVNMFEKDRARMLCFTDWDDSVLSSISAPVLLVSTDKDVVTPRHTIEMAALIPSCELMILPGTHGSCIAEGIPVEQLDNTVLLTIAIIKGFLKQ